MLGSLVLFAQNLGGAPLVTWPYRIQAGDSLTGPSLGGGTMAYEPGQTIAFSAQVDVKGVLTDALGLSLTLHSPGGAADVVVAALTHDALGQYHADVALPIDASPGMWTARWRIAGPLPALTERLFVLLRLDF